MADIKSEVSVLVTEHYPRVAELSTGLSLCGLSSYVMDVRIEQLGFALSANRAAVTAFALILLLTGIGQIAAVVGFGSLWKHSLIPKRGEQWMQTGFMLEFYCRRAFTLMASVEWGVWGGSLSGTRIASSLVGASFILLMSASYVRMGLSNEWRNRQQ